MLTNSARAPRRARTRASKCYNAPIRSKLILHTFQAILSIFKICARVIMRARFRAYPRVLAFCKIESPNFFCYNIYYIFPSILIPCLPFSDQ